MKKETELYGAGVLGIPTIEDRLNFIRNLEIESYAGEKLPEELTEIYGNSGSSSNVDGSSLISFVGNLGAQNRSDVLNSTLLAQLAANKQYDREKNPEGWYKYYSYVLENVGWVLQTFIFERYQDAASPFTAANAVLKMFAAICSQNELLALKSMLDAFSSLTDDDGRARIFESSSHSNESGNFQLGVCIENMNQVVMTLGTAYFSTKSKVTKVLWFKFKSNETKMYLGNQAITLNNDVYSQVRQDVIKKLGNNAKEFILELEI